MTTALHAAEMARERRRCLYAANPEKYREMAKRSREVNREKHLERARQWHENNPEKTRQANRRWRATHPEKHRAACRRWHEANPGARNQITANRRARVRGAEGSHTLAEWKALLESHPACHYCGRTDRKLTRDHIVPLSRGGSHWISNIVPACHSCNSKKGSRL